MRVTNIQAGSNVNREVWYLTSKIDLLESVIAGDNASFFGNLLKKVFPDAEKEVVVLRERLASVQVPQPAVTADVQSPTATRPTASAVQPHCTVPAETQ